jgi:DNA gyrase subunit A
MATKKSSASETVLIERDPALAVVPIEIVDEMKKSFIEYSMSVITSRALPDVRDGLKPVHRRILYAMYRMGLHPGGKFTKSAKIVGEVLGKYHPHGDTSVYDAMVGLAQEFSTRYMLVAGQGNFGSQDGDSAAAYRYTEAKLSRVAEILMRDIEKSTVDYSPNFDGTEKEPRVLPSAVPTLLLNGVLGIAVGMATNMPPHNAGEVIDATVHLLENPKATTEDLLEFVKGPDFPTGGIAYNRDDIVRAYTTGRGGVTVRGEAVIENGKAGKTEIIITSVPYRVNRANLIIKIAELVNDKKIKGIKDIRDESTRDTRIVIEIRNGFIPEKILNFIYKHTELQSNFNYNMTALVDGVPETLSLRDMLHYFIEHRFEVVRRRTEYDLAVARARAHILEGLKIALDHIDEVIKIIRASKDTETAKVNLMAKFKFTEIQAVAILDMRLQRLAGLERQKVIDELAEKMKLIKALETLLESKTKMKNVIREELLVMRDLIADERRTRIVKKALGVMTDEDLVPDTEMVCMMSADGYIKRTDPSEYKAQKRGGVGVGDLDTKNDDVITHTIVGSTHSDILFFTDKGRVYSVKMYDIPEGRKSTKGKAIQSLLPLTSSERVTSILEVPKTTKNNAEGLSLMLVTAQGVTKRTDVAHVTNLRKSGIAIIDLDNGDELLSADVVTDKDEILLVSREAQSIRFAVSEVRVMGRAAGGVKAMTLKNDRVVGCAKIDDTNRRGELLVVSTHGYGKKTELSEYKVQGRGGSGVGTLNVTDKTGVLVGGVVVMPTDVELIAMSGKGQVVRTALEQIPTLGRTTQGVRIMKLREGDSLAGLALL